MKKFKLDLDDLRVQSFTAHSDGQNGARGTVRGYAYFTEVSCNACEDTNYQICEATMGDTCTDTCGTTSCPSLNCDCASQVCQTEDPACYDPTNSQRGCTFLIDPCTGGEF